MLKLNQTMYGPFTYQKSVKQYTTYLFGYPANSVWSAKSYSGYNSNKCSHHVRLKKTFFDKILRFFIFSLFHGLCLTAGTFTTSIAKVTLTGWKDIYFTSLLWIINWFLQEWKTDKLMLHFTLNIERNFFMFWDFVLFCWFKALNVFLP